MTRTAKKHVLDHLAEWVGSLTFAGGLAFAALQLADGKTAAIVAVGSFALAIGILSRIGERPTSSIRFAPVGMDFEPLEDEELMLTDPLPAQPAKAAAAAHRMDEESELLLDDPIVAERDDRVVQLFAADAKSPGAMIARIEDYLGRGAVRIEPLAPPARRPTPAPDASEALHAALANIRASLR